MPLSYERIMAYRPADIPIAYGPRDCIIYALGIGIGMDPMDLGQLKFVYEKELAAFPSMAVVLGRHGPLRDPAFGLDHRMMVAAALKVVLHEPLATEAKLVARPRVRAVIDKGVGSAAIIEMTRDLLARTAAWSRPSTTARWRASTAASAARSRRSTSRTQCRTQPRTTWSICRRRPISHCSTGSPATRIRCMPIPSARSVGFPRPILHGAATFGIATHAVVRHIDYRAEGLASIEARFVRPVYPGDTLRTEIWRDGNRISFQCSALGRDGLVLTNGLATLRP